MDWLTEMIVAGSETLDVYVMVRIVCFALVLEFVGSVVNSLGGFRR